MEIDRNKELPIPFLRECLDYNPETGILTWKERPESHFLHSSRADGGFNKKFAGKVAGNVMGRGYIWITLCGQSHFAHRLAWAIHYGKYPDGIIDHDNGDRTDNRIINLVESTNEKNSRNQKMRRTNTSGHMGVCLRKDTGKYRSFIQEGGKRIWIGNYDTFEEAVAARVAAEKKYGYHENHGRN